MTSIASKTLSEIARDVADDVAFELGLPWRVKDLRAEALRACRTAMQRAARSGLSSEHAFELLERQRERIKGQVLKAEGGLEALPLGQSEPTPEQMEMALEAFTVKQWTTVESLPPMEDWRIIESRYGLMERVGPAEVETLLSYMRRNADELKQRFGARKIEAIEGRAIERNTKLWLAENRSKLEPISDPYWAAVLPELAREANRTGKGHPAKGRSVAEELGSNRAIARRLTKRDHQTGREMKVDDREVKRWHERMEKLPFEQYAAAVGADDEYKSGAALIDYLTMIRAKHRRKKRHIPR